MTDVLITRPADRVALVEMRRPPTNFFDEALLTAVADAQLSLDDDSSISAVVLCSEGKHFCAGADLRGIGAAGLRRMYRQAFRIFSNHKPMIAAVQGAAIGGGLGLAMAADFRVAAPDARLTANFARLGFHHGFGLSVTLPAAVGPQIALELLYTGRIVNGEEAVAMRLVRQGRSGSARSSDRIRLGCRAIGTALVGRHPVHHATVDGRRRGCGSGRRSQRPGRATRHHRLHRRRRRIDRKADTCIHRQLMTTEGVYMKGSAFEVLQLSDEHNELRAVLRELCDKEIAPYAADVDEKARYTDEALAVLNSSGFSAIHIPEEYGGQGGDSIAACIVIEEVARVCASSSLIPICNKLGTMGLLMNGSEELKKQVLPSIGAGEATASYALSEREAGSDAAAMRTRARQDGDEWVLNGAKCWISNGGHSTWYTVMAVTDPDEGANGISAFVVHEDDRGFSVGPKERKLGIKGSPTTELYFEDCRISGDRIIGEPGTGFKTALATLDHTRPTIGAQAVGIAQGALEAAIAYTKERKQFGKAISDFQAVQFMLADMAMKIEAARLMVYSAAARAERMEPDLGFISSASKCFASDVAMEVTTNAVQLFGGYGYTADFPVERFMRDAKITQIYEGTNQIQRVVMSRALLR